MAGRHADPFAALGPHVAGEGGTTAVDRSLRNAILLPGEDREGAARVAERIIARMERSIDVEGQALEVGVSIGIALHPVDGQDDDTLLINADAAMHDAKERGRSMYRFYNQSMNAAAHHPVIASSRSVPSVRP